MNFNYEGCLRLLSHAQPAAIGKAAAGTPQIAENSVTVQGTSTGSADSASVTITLDQAGMVLVTATFFGAWISEACFRLMVEEQTFSESYANCRGGVSHYVPVTMSSAVLLGAGTYTFSLNTRNTSNRACASSTITVFGVKR